ncbi:MAG TPA: PEGA domain-containing protein [Candidatus Sulfotelmatobacter sp.]|nr:PEGA domain-containing protein [Candidatus Sulfotelmatobacter sp.]
MNHRRSAAWLAAWLCLSLCAGAAVKNGSIRITVVDSQTRSVTLDNSGVEKNCDGVNYDAYCHNSKTAEITNLLLVREGDRPPFWVSCSVDTKWSRCTPLPKGESFNARQEKRGLSIYFVDDNGKVRQQLYAYVSERSEGKSEAVAAAASQPVQIQPGPATTAAGARTSEPEVKIADAVKCSFASTPAGAEITVDGKYAGSTPSTLSLSLGTHAVEISLPGFVQWKRQLTVSSGSELTVNAVLEKVR